MDGGSPYASVCPALPPVPERKLTSRDQGSQKAEERGKVERVAFPLLPSAFCLLPSAFCLLPSALCLQIRLTRRRAKYAAPMTPTDAAKITSAVAPVEKR